MTIDEKYLINPFIKEVKSKSFINRKYTMNIIQGTTGLGKTYAEMDYEKNKDSQGMQIKAMALTIINDIFPFLNKWNEDMLTKIQKRSLEGCATLAQP